MNSLFYDSSTHFIFITTERSSFIEPILWLKKPRLGELTTCPKSPSRKCQRDCCIIIEKAVSGVSETHVNPDTSSSLYYGRARLVIWSGPKCCMWLMSTPLGKATLRKALGKPSWLGHTRGTGVLPYERLLPWALPFRVAPQITDFCERAHGHFCHLQSMQHSVLMWQNLQNPKHVLLEVTFSILGKTLCISFPVSGHHWMPSRFVGCHWHCFWVQRRFWIWNHLGNRKGKLTNLLIPSSQIRLLY